MKPSLLLISFLLTLGDHSSTAAESAKDAALRSGGAPSAATALTSRDPGGAGHRITLTNGVARVPVIVVRGTPYQMGWQLGRLMRDEIQQLAPAVVAGFKQELKVTDETLDLAWATTAGYTDGRVQQQLVGLAEGSGQPVRLIQHVHCLPLLMPYSCSSIAAWGDSTEDGHLYQTRNLDWSLKAGAHEFPVLVVYLPTEGHAHVTPSFAGFIGAHCGMNAAGIVVVDGVNFGVDVRASNAVAEVTFAHKTGLTYNYASDAGIVTSLPGRPFRRYIIVFLSNLGYRYVGEVFADRTKGPYADPVGNHRLAQKAGMLRACLVLAMKGALGLFETALGSRKTLRYPRLN